MLLTLRPLSGLGFPHILPLYQTGEDHEFLQGAPQDLELDLVNSQVSSTSLQEILLSDLNRILVTQTHVDMPTLKAYQRRKSLPVPDSAYVLQFGHYYLFLNGHHRLAAAVLRGQSCLKWPVKTFFR